MKKNITLLLIVLAFVGCSTQVSGQDSLKTQPKNIIYASAGTLGLWFTASANYERKLFSTDNKFYANYYLRACAGASASWGADGPYGSLSLQGVYGAKKSHLELGLGLSALFDKGNYDNDISYANYFNEPDPSRGDYTDWLPAVTIGYRYQRPMGGIVFRTGIGFPDGAYLSLGLAF
ncbi:hypothetical protein [Maribacter sp. LLG6340-A2]|uniref:hypothetical protein n=1 Tax=Maribacter sp. LLG6340-A2 TaxID=3160834 RepID=UPI003868CFAB